MENKLPVLDLECNVNRKQKKINFIVHYKPTKKQLKKRSNHRENTKKGVIKGYSDRARALCDPQYLQDELQNIEEVFVENGYSRREVRKAMEERQMTERRRGERGDEEQRNRINTTRTVVHSNIQ